MASGTGLGSVLMFGAETTWNTPVTVDHSPRFLSETLNLNKVFLQDEGLRGGGYIPLAAGNVEVQRGVDGGWVMDLPTRGFGALLKQMLGSTITVPTVIVAPAYKQVHQVGITDGFGMTVQVQRPQKNGTIKPFTYQGMKVVGWEIAISVGGLVTLTLTLDGADGVTATAAATYAPIAGTKAWSFGQASVLKTGGTASTTSGIVSVASGTTVTSLIKDLKFTQTRGTANQEYGVGFGGVKGEQINNAWGDIKISFTAEFGAQSDFYDPYIAGTVMPFQCTLLGSAVGASVDTFDIIASAAKIIDTNGPNVAGPGILEMSVTMQVLDDAVNSPFQCTIISADTTL